MRISKTFRFEAGHRLEGWPNTHKCYNLHGHSYKVEVVVEGPVRVAGSCPGAVIDFKDIRMVWTRLHDLLDHHVLNEVLNEKNVTAEYLAKYIFWQMHKHIGVVMIRVWETEDAYAEYTPEG